MIGVDGYILKSQAVAALSKYGLSNGSALGHHSGAVECAIAEIEAINPVDAVPVVHGRWEWYDHTISFAWIDRGYMCSACGHKQEDETNYCPNCGAKMDLEVDGDG